jgi:hypothetical protein
VSSETRLKNTDTFLSFAENDWHPLQRVDEDGVPKVFDILNTFTKFLSVFDEAKAVFNTPSLIFEEVSVAFTLYVNWLNRARLVNFAHVGYYIEFRTSNSVSSTLTRFSWRSGAFIWTTPLSREWSSLLLRHGLLEASSTNTSDSFYLSKVYFKSSRVTFQRIFFFDVFPNCFQVQTKLVTSRAGSQEPSIFVPFDPKKEPSFEDGNANFEVWTFENPMTSDVLDMLFSFYWEFDNACFIFPVDALSSPFRSSL